MQQPDEQKPQAITFPDGTTFGGASRSQASTLAQLIVDSNNNNMKDYEQLEGTASKNLQTSQQALQMLEHLSQQQGTGDITLFFPTGSAALLQGSLQYQRLINLPLSQQPRPQNFACRDRQRLGDRKHEHQSEAFAGALRGTGADYRSVSGQ
jgi:hypothetical protein